MVDGAPHGNSAEDPNSAQPQDFAMVLRNLQLISGSNAILRSVSMAVPKKRLLGILGESGAGKTTLLRLIARKLNEDVLTIKGEGRLPEEIWFIAQEDVLYEYDTPMRVMTFLHQMKYGEGMEAAEKQAHILLDTVRFPANLKTSIIGTPDVHERQGHLTR